MNRPDKATDKKIANHIYTPDTYANSTDTDTHKGTNTTTLFNFKEFKDLYYKPLFSYYSEKEFDKTHKYAVKLENDLFTVIDTPNIKTRFCFADDYDTPEDPNSSRMCHHAETNTDYFIEENLKGINGKIRFFEENNFAIMRNYGKTNIVGAHKVIKYGDEWVDHLYLKPVKDMNGYIRLMTESEKAKIIEAYKQVKADFEKRLNTYLKRYGLSKIETWTYWANR